MSSAQDDKAIPDLEAVGKAYREAGLDDEPPAHVDAFIRAAAKHESKRNLNDYLPALAMAATIVLALGLVLRLTVPGRDLIEPAGVPEAEDAAAPRVQEPAALQESGVLQDPDAFQERAAPLADSVEPAAEFVPAPPQAVEQGAQERAVRLEEVVTPARASAATAEDNGTATSAPAAANAQEGIPSSVVGRMAAPSPVSVPCAAPERDEPALWLGCIAAQINAGLLEAARAELEQFRLAFADYPVPASIAEPLDP